MPQLLNEEAPSPRRDRLEDALALADDIHKAAAIIKRLIGPHAIRADKNARNKVHMQAKRAEQRTTQSGPATRARRRA